MEAASPLKRNDPELQELLQELRDTQSQLQGAHAAFNQASEPELIESAVYQISALQARYAYLLRRVRELDGTVSGPGAPYRRQKP